MKSQIQDWLFFWLSAWLLDFPWSWGDVDRPEFLAIYILTFEILLRMDKRSNGSSVRAAFSADGCF